MNYYDNIKELLINNEITKRVKNYSVNKSDLDTYYSVGKELSEAGKHYGEGIIKEYSKKLQYDLNKTYNERTLRRYRQFYNFAINLKWSAMPTKLSWSHITELMSLSDENEINYYISVVENSNISYRKLNKRIKSKEYERLPLETKNKLMMKEEVNVKDLVPNPIIIRNKNNIEDISEKVLQKQILEDIPSFLEELGEGFTFMKNEYPIKLSDRYNYIDLLLYNIKYKCYVVVELKVTELKKEHIGQIEVYMNYIDNNFKRIDENKTLGIIICKINNECIIKYSSDERIIAREYILI